MTPKRKIFYGWFIVAISLAIMTAVYGVYMSWPAFYVAILDEFGWTRAETALIFSIAATVYGISSPISGFLFDKFGPRRLFILSAVLLAIGVIGSSQATEIWQLGLFFGVFVGFATEGAGFIPNVALVSNWFEKKRARALGISQIGTRDTFLLLPLIQLSILAIGWRNSYLVLAAATAIIIIPLSFFLRARPQDMGLLPDGETITKEKESTMQNEKDDRIVDREWASTEWTSLKAMKRIPFWALFFIMLGAGFSFTALLNHFVALMTDVGYTAMFAAGLLFIYAITAMLGRIFGFISDLIGREWALTLAMALMMFALLVLLIVKDTSTPWAMYIFIALFGFGSGLYTPPYAAGAADLFQGKNFGAIVGFANVGYGLGAAIGTWLYGYIFDVTGAYTLAIIITMVAVGVMAISMWLAAPRKVRRVAGKAPKNVGL